MRLVYPYNEILPKKRAHDVFIFNECHALSQAGISVDLLCGSGSFPSERLFHHYGLSDLETFKVDRLPILRKNTFLNLSWNLPFFLASQKKIASIRPDFVLSSVLKQAYFHFSKKIEKVRYVYEVHELSYYPNQPKPSKNFSLEKKTLEKADLIVVTTSCLKEILVEPPYSLKVPIQVLPLAVRQEKLPKKTRSGPLTLMYIGQLYDLQGIENLLKAMEKVEGVELKIVGGILGKKMKNVEFLGFHAPSKLSEIAQHADAFVAPFKNAQRMPYVAHTKLFEYAEMGKPFIAPDLPIVREHFQTGVLFFEPDNVASLTNAIQSLKEENLFKKLEGEIASYSSQFSWKARADRYLDILRRVK